MYCQGMRNVEVRLRIRAVLDWCGLDLGLGLKLGLGLGLERGF